MAERAAPAGAPVPTDLQRRLPPIIAGLSVLGPFTIDTYLPAFDAIGAELNATPLQVQQTLTAYIATFAFMALWHGSLSDAIGRRRVLIGGLLLFALASIGAATSQTIEQLWFWRALQGVVAGTGMTVGRAVVRDVAEGPMAQRMLSQAMMLFAIAPAIAPIIGGWLFALAGWRPIFLFLAVVALAMTWLCWRSLPETLPPEARQSLHPVALGRAYADMFGSAAFMRLAGALMLNFIGFFIYVLAAPALVMGLLGLSPQSFGWLFLPGVAGTAFGAYLSSRLAGRLSLDRTIACGYAVMSIAVAFNVAQAVWLQPSVPFAVAPLFVYNTGLMLAMSPLQVKLLDLFPARRGMASSGHAFVQSTGNAVAAGVISPMLWHSLLAMALGSTVLMALGGLLFLWHVRAVRARERAAVAAHGWPRAGGD